MAGKPAAKFDKLPKKKQHGQLCLDREKIRDLYLNGNNYSWISFCKAHNWEPKRARDAVFKDNHGEFQGWKLEWQKTQLNIHDEEVLPEALATTKFVALRRIQFVTEWNNRTKYLKTFFDATIDRHMKQLREDHENALVKTGAIPPSFKLDMEELNVMAGVALRLQELEQRSLLVVANPKKIEQLQKEVEDQAEDIPEIEVHQIGKSMTGPETVALMASYFDQFEKKAEKVPAQTQEVKPDEENPV